MIWKLLLVTAVLVLNASFLPAQDVEYTIFNDTEEEAKEDEPSDESSSNWSPLTQSIFGGDIHDIFRVKENVYSWSIALSERLDLLCDIQSHAPVEPAVYTFGGLAFNR